MIAYDVMSSMMPLIRCQQPLLQSKNLKNFNALKAYFLDKEIANKGFL